MKIGILTYHRSHNYGALLQSIATRVVLERLGHEAYYVDYWPGYHRRMYALIDEKIIFSRHIRRTYHYLKDKVICVFMCKKHRRANMNRFISLYIEPYCKPVSEQFDIILYGSDQIWRKQPEDIGYNPVYFGENAFKSNKHIAYAASMGILPDNEKDIAIVKELVSHLTKISVRENDLKSFLNGIGFTNVSLCLDPTLLLTSYQWDCIFKAKEKYKEKYVLFYDLLPNSFRSSELDNFALRHKCKLKILHSAPTPKETPNCICTASPEDFINLIRDAEFVFTSSFHGLVFSITYKKPFLASFSRNSNRAESILQQLGLSEYLIPPMAAIPTDVKPIDYNNVMERMERMRIVSMEYLTSLQTV